MKRILIVEDEPELQELLCAYLQDAGYAAAVAGDGAAALDLFRAQSFDLVLLEKIRVILRRSGEAAESRLHYRDLVVDLDTREAALDGRPLDLTAREFELLRTFLAAPGRVFTREMLLSRLWGYDFFGDERVVDSHIKNLRHKLGRDYIETVRGVGYRAAKETR